MPTPIPFALSPPAAAPPAPPPFVASMTTSTQIFGDTTSPFWGSGIVRPFRRDQKSDIANASGLALIKACVGQVLATRAAGQLSAAISGAMVVYGGELRWRPEFGSKLYILKHAKGGPLSELARYYCADALAKWEPRVTNVNAIATFYPLSYSVEINLVYDVISKNAPGNQVLVQGVQQTVGLSVAA